MEEPAHTRNGYDYSPTFEPAIELGTLSPPQAREVTPVDYSHMISIIAAWKDILNARLLAIVALLGALIIFGGAVYDPLTQRIWGASLYAIGVLWPTMILYAKKG